MMSSNVPVSRRSMAVCTSSSLGARTKAPLWTSSNTAFNPARIWPDSAPVSTPAFSPRRGSVTRDDPFSVRFQGTTLTWSRCFLESQDKTKDIKLYINSPGGSVTAGLAIYDTMRYIKPDVATICLGMAASMGAVLLAAGAKGKRFVLPNAEVMIHQIMGGAEGQVVAVDGNPVVPIKGRKFPLATAQRLDILVRMPRQGVQEDGIHQADRALAVLENRVDGIPRRPRNLGYDRPLDTEQCVVQ